MTLDEVRAELREMAETYNLPRLAELAEETKRRRFGKGRPTSRKCTDDIKHKIVEYARLNPHKSQTQIAELFRVNAGRVSEALHGFRQ